MKALLDLQKLGYAFHREDKDLKYVWGGVGQPSPSLVRPLLEEIKTKKQEVLDYLDDQSQAQPYFRQEGFSDEVSLVIPYNCLHKYRWWAEGQSIADTLNELGASGDVWKSYTDQPYPEKD